MKCLLIFGLVCLAAAAPSIALGQTAPQRPDRPQRPAARDFDSAKPTLGDAFPAQKIYDADGKEFDTAQLRGNYTLITLGCLTCPPFLNNVPELEAVYRDYQSRGVRFYFVYRAVAHPELRGSYLQTFTLEERVAHVRQATKQLGTTIPFLVDAMDNRLKHALGGRANCEYLIDPDGKVVRKRMWSDPRAVRQDLETLVGKVERPTSPQDLKLPEPTPLSDAAPRGFVDRVARAGMWPLVSTPQIETGGPPFYAKLRAEADLGVIDKGRGKLYIGFHLDPLYQVHWNRLTDPVQFEIELPKGVAFSTTSGKAARLDVENDCDPREFLLDVSAWPADLPIKLKVAYAACSDKDCHVVTQTYVLRRERDIDGGRAAPAGFRGAMKPEALVKMLLEGDTNGDGQLKRDEVPSLIRNSFADHDRNGDGVLSTEELRALAEEHTRFLPAEAERASPGVK
ncbi:MAG: redoxin domain-containing protein [Pirellulales bacterium]